MKTTIQEMIEKLKDAQKQIMTKNEHTTGYDGALSDCIFVAESFLEKEKKQIIESCEWGLNDACEQSEKGGFVKISKGDEYYAETYGSTP